MDLHPFVERFARRLAEVESALGDPSVFNDQKKSQELTREYNRLKNLVGKGKEYQKIEVEIRDNEELIASEPAESEMAQMAKEDLVSLKKRFEESIIQLQMGIVPPTPPIVEIPLSKFVLEQVDLSRLYLPPICSGCLIGIRMHAAGSWKSWIVALRTLVVLRKLFSASKGMMSSRG